METPTGIRRQYEVLGKISEGGMGAVFKVRHQLLDEIRVIKVVRSHLSDQKEYRDRFLREARIATRLRHPNVAELYDCNLEEDGSAYMVIEFVDGQTIKEMVAQRGPLAVGLGLQVMIQCLDVLGFLEQQNIVHRDLSPDNIMVHVGADGKPVVKLIDLGIAKSLEADSGLTGTGVFVGKVRYAAPEQFRLEDGYRVDHRSDLYSISIVFFEMLTGRCPIGGSSMEAILAGHLYGEPLGFGVADPTGRVPADLRAAVMKGLAREPKARFQSAAEYLAAICPILKRFESECGEPTPDLTRAVAGEGTTVVPPGLLPVGGAAASPDSTRLAPLEAHPAEAPAPLPELTRVIPSEPEPQSAGVPGAPVTGIASRLVPKPGPRVPEGPAFIESARSDGSRGEARRSSRRIALAAAGTALMLMVCAAAVTGWIHLRERPGGSGVEGSSEPPPTASVGDSGQPESRIVVDEVSTPKPGPGQVSRRGDDDSAPRGGSFEATQRIERRGTQIQNAASELSRRAGTLGIKVRSPAQGVPGALVYFVTPGGAGEVGGLRVGDVIVGADRVRVTFTDDLSGALEGKFAGSDLTLEVVRASSSLRITVVLGSR